MPLSRRAVAIAVLSVAAAALAWGVVWLVRGLWEPANFDSSVVRIDGGYDFCVRIAKSEYGATQDTIDRSCPSSSGATWFRVTIVNHSFAGPYLDGCLINGLDARNQIRWQGDFQPGPNQALYNNVVFSGREKAVMTWFVAGSPPPTDVTRYTATCPAHYDTPPI